MSKQEFKLNDLPEDCLMEILGRLQPTQQLLKISQVNKRLKKLAEIKLRVNIKMLIVRCSELRKFLQIGPSCEQHFGSLESNEQMIFFHNHSKNKSLLCEDLKVDTYLSSILSKCSGVKSIEFQDPPINNNHLLMLVQLCPELECIKFFKNRAQLANWNQFFDQIGSKIVHFEMIINNKTFDGFALDQFMETVAKKCNNIKKVDFIVRNSRSYIEAFKKLPRSCRVNLTSDDRGERDLNFEIRQFEPSADVVENIDELCVYPQQDFNWSGFSNRVERLSRLKFDRLSLNSVNASPHGVIFAGLKELKFYLQIASDGTRPMINCLAASQFPVLESLSFDFWGRINENDYQDLLRQMQSIKKLSIDMSVNQDTAKVVSIPEQAIRCLRKLETFELKLLVKTYPHMRLVLKLDHVLKPLESYENWIESLRKMIIRVTFRGPNEELNRQAFYDRMKQLRKKQMRVDVVYEGKIWEY